VTDPELSFSVAPVTLVMDASPEIKTSSRVTGARRSTSNYQTIHTIPSESLGNTENNIIRER